MTADRPITRLLVANRGEIARRIFRTCRTLGIETVAVHSDPDVDSLHVHEADRAVRLPGAASRDTYLRADLVVDAAMRSGADAIHPGYGFLSENADFARLVLDADLNWVGPSPDTIAAMGSKIKAKQLMREAGVPTLDVDRDALTDTAFPLLVKASAGGGGRGMRVVRTADRLDAEVSAARDEARSAFGDDTVFIEPYLPTARHVEVQVVADQHGTCWVVGDRDCSIQRRHQKVIEEAPAPGLPGHVRSRLHDAARAAVGAVDYVGAGTVEFLVAGHDIFFLEMNTRLQVEHPVTECVFDIDLVAAQLEVAAGSALPPREFTPHGHAIEARLYAEDPAAGWAPQTGCVAQFDIPSATREFAPLQEYGVRVDSGVAAGSMVGVHYDPMLAKVIAWSPDRRAACRVLADALRRAHIHGIATNAPLLRTILQDADFLAGRVHTSLLEERVDQWIADHRQDWTAAASAAALSDAVAAQAGRKVQQRIPAAWRNVPSRDQSRRYRVGGEVLEVTYRSVRGALRLEGTELSVESVHPGEVSISSGRVTTSYDVQRDADSTFVDGPDGSVDLSHVPRFTDPQEATASGSLIAPMPGVVTSVTAAVGDVVAAGDALIVIEAMKMQHTIIAPTDGTVGALTATEGAQVTAGDVLAVIDEFPTDGT